LYEERGYISNYSQTQSSLRADVKLFITRWWITQFDRLPCTEYSKWYSLQGSYV